MESSQGIYQDSEGNFVADIALRHQDGRSLASVRVRTAGHTIRVSPVLSSRRKG